jgi:hypothetical protein
VSTTKNGACNTEETGVAVTRSLPVGDIIFLHVEACPKLAIPDSELEAKDDVVDSGVVSGTGESTLSSSIIPVYFFSHCIQVFESASSKE